MARGVVHDRGQVSDRELLDQLTIVSRTLMVVCRNAGEHLSEDFKSMITGPADAVEQVLLRCPDPGMSSWDGEFRFEDCDLEFYTPESPHDAKRTGVGVIMKHIPTGISVKVDQKPTREGNEEIARNAIRRRVEEIGA